MDTLSRKARIAGLLYLVLICVAPIRLIYIPSVIFVAGNASATARGIAAHESLFRLGMFADLVTAFIGIFLTLSLFRLLVGVDRKLAIVMAILGCADVPIYFINTLNDAGALIFARGADFLSAFSPLQRDAMTMVFVQLHSHGVVVNEVFWGLWLLPLGVLVYRSGFLPRILGAWLVVNCFAYLAQVVTGLLLPQYDAVVSTAAIPAQFGEIAIMLWLILIGPRERRPVVTVRSSA